jgi:hypothetical protein
MKNNLLADTEIPFLMSQADLKNLGLDEVGYVKKYSMNGKPAWVLHAADGRALAVQDNADAARVSAQHQDLDLVPVH